MAPMGLLRSPERGRLISSEFAPRRISETRPATSTALKAKDITYPIAAPTSTSRRNSSSKCGKESSTGEPTSKGSPESNRTSPRPKRTYRGKVGPPKAGNIMPMGIHRAAPSATGKNSRKLRKETIRAS